MQKHKFVGDFRERFYITLKNTWSAEQVTDHVTLYVHGKNVKHIKLLEQWLFGYSLLVNIICF